MNKSETIENIGIGAAHTRKNYVRESIYKTSQGLRKSLKGRG